MEDVAGGDFVACFAYSHLPVSLQPSGLAGFYETRGIEVMKLKRVAVTGASGLLGQDAVAVLSDLTEVVALDIAPGTAGRPYRYADVMSLESLREAFSEVNAVVHLAALQMGAPEENIFTLNTIGTWNVLQAAREQGVGKVVLVSSEAALGMVTLSGSPPALPDYLPISEEHALKPTDAYGVSKEASEAIARAFARSGDMQVVILRPTTVYAPGMEDHMRQARERDDPYFWLYVEVNDVSEAIRLALEYDAVQIDCFFVSAPDTFSPEETLSFMRRRFGRLPEIRDPALYHRSPFATVFDTSRAETILGLNPTSNWRRYLGEVLER